MPAVWRRQTRRMAASNTSNGGAKLYVTLCTLKNEYHYRPYQPIHQRITCDIHLSHFFRHNVRPGSHKFATQVSNSFDLVHKAQRFSK